MALSRAFVEAHIVEWEGRLSGGIYAHREKWPRRLFHHGPIENIVSILNSGVLRSRADPQNPRPKDVAAAGVIDARAEAYRYARLYFRPRTPTQFHIEGVRKPADCHYGPGAHAPVLFMLIFDALPILELPSTRFSDKNMQLAGVRVLSTEQEFSQIPFAKVYSEGGTGGDRSYIDHRCAEVLADSPLALKGCLQWVYCRSEAEKLFLLNELNKSGRSWKAKIVVSDDLRVFEKKYAFMDDVSISSKGIVFKINPRSDHAELDVRVSAWDDGGAKIVDFHNDSMKAIPPSSTRWIVMQELADGFYRVRIDLEGHRAFEARMSVGDVLF